MTSPLNEPMTEEKAREILKNCEGENPSFALPYRRYAAGYIERVEQEKFILKEPSRPSIREFEEAIEAADRMASCFNSDGTLWAEQDLETYMKAYRAARAKVGG